MRFLPVLCLPLFMAAAADLAADRATELRVGNFTSHAPGEEIPHHWQTLTFKKIDRYTDYRLVRDGNSTVIEANSKNSASGLSRKISIDPEKFRRVRWSWKIGNMLPGSDAGRKEGDDYPARLYLLISGIVASSFVLDPRRGTQEKRAKS